MFRLVKHFQILVVLRMGVPIVENVPTHSGAGSIQGYPKVTPDYPRLSKAIQVLRNVGQKNISWDPLIPKKRKKKKTNKLIKQFEANMFLFLSTGRPTRPL